MMLQVLVVLFAILSFTSAENFSIAVLSDVSVAPFFKLLLFISLCYFGIQLLVFVPVAMDIY